MANVGSIYGVDVDSISKIYIESVGSIESVLGITINGGGQSESGDTDFSFSGGYTPPDGDGVNFF